MDINKVSAEQLESAFQVDGTRARYIIEHRRTHGPFKSWDDVKQVPGFEDQMVQNLQAAGLRIGERTSRDQGEGRPSAGGIDLNSASAEELERVFQVDGQRARYLIDARDRIGGFQSWDDVKREAPSFEEGMIENLKRAGARIGSKTKSAA